MIYTILYYGSATVLALIIALVYLVVTSPYQKGPLKKLIRIDPSERNPEINDPPPVTPPPWQIYRAIDDVLEKIVDYAFRDYFESWFVKLTNEEESKQTVEQLKVHVLIFLRNLYRRVSQVDASLFICNRLAPVLTDHIKQMNCVTYDVNSDTKVRSFQVHVCLQSPKALDDYLRKLASFLVNLCGSESILQSDFTRFLVRELVTKYVLHSIVDTMSQPEYINKLICDYLQIENKEKRTKGMPSSFNYRDLNGFIQAINSIDDVDRIQSLCKRIVNEINQATMLQIVKEENQRKGYKMKSTESSLINSRPSTKADRLMARDLKRYISELSLAKARAERRIIQLGGSLENSNYVGLAHTSSRKTSMRELAVASSQRHVLPASLMDILKDNEGFLLFFNYAVTLSQGNWCKFWKEVELLRQEESMAQYRRADKIYHEFIHYCTDPNFKLPPPMCKKMHQYILGNSTIHAFFEAQSFVAVHMERNILPGFLVTVTYNKWSSEKEEMRGNRSDALKFLDTDNTLQASVKTRTSSLNASCSSIVAEEEVSKLKELKDKIMRKNNVIHQMQESTIKYDLKLMQELQAEVVDLSRQAVNMESLIDDMNAWFNHKGLYTLSVSDCLMMPEKHSNEPTFIIELFLGKSETDTRQGNGLVILKSLQEILNLHSSLLSTLGWLKRFEMPKLRRFRSYDEEYFSEAKILVDAFLNALIADPVAFDNERLFNFFRNSEPETTSGDLGNTSESSLRNKFSTQVNMIGKKIRIFSELESDPGDVVSAMPGPILSPGPSYIIPEDAYDDQLSEPLFKLIDEVFELRGMLKVFRHSLMTFLRSRYHMTLSKRIRDFFGWCFSDSMLRYYCETFLNSYWPNGQSAAAPLVNDSGLAEKEKLRNRAVEMICKWVHNNRDDVYCLLLGEKNLTRGVVKVFTSLQEETFNKHLIIRVLETFMRELLVNVKDSGNRVVTSCDMSFQLVTDH